jgi:ribosomal protein L40E
MARLKVIEGDGAERSDNRSLERWICPRCTGHQGRIASTLLMRVDVGGDRMRVCARCLARGEWTLVGD